MDRIETVKEYINNILLSLEEIQKISAYIHLYGVSQNCAILAMARNEDCELASIAGLLHDLYAFKTGIHQNHAKTGSIFAKDLLESLNIFNDEEISKICTAILNHSSKSKIDSNFDEVLKDADVMHHCFYNILYPISENEKIRFNKISKELNLIN